MDAYETYIKKSEEYAKINKENIMEVNKDIPQHILWQKTISDKFEDDKAKTVTMGDNFYFTERMVNKLMYFSYIKGSIDINKKSHKQGWDDCLHDVSKKLGLDNS